MSQIYRYELFSVGMDFRDGFGFSVCQTGVYQWFDISRHVRYIDFLVSTEKFEGSIPARPARGSATRWRLKKQDGYEEETRFYQRTSDLLKEISDKKIFIGVEY